MIPVNRLILVRVIDKEILIDSGRWHYPSKDITELNKNGISTYTLKQGTKNKLNIQRIKVQENKMREFFDYLYNFARQATESDTLEDDFVHEVQFIYSSCHKEIFTLPVFKGDECMIDIIKQFVDSCREES